MKSLIRTEYQDTVSDEPLSSHSSQHMECSHRENHDDLIVTAENPTAVILSSSDENDSALESADTTVFDEALDSLYLTKDAEWLTARDAFQNRTICYQSNNSAAMIIFAAGICTVIFITALYIQLHFSTQLPIIKWPLAIFLGAGLAAVCWGALGCFSKTWISISQTHILIERGMRRKNVAIAFERNPQKTTVEMKCTRQLDDSSKYSVSLAAGEREYEIDRGLSQEAAASLTEMMNQILEL